MDVDHGVAKIAAAIGEPARARMLYCLMDNRSRTSTELAVVAGVTPSTASVHLTRLRDERLVKMQVQGKHRYYTLAGEHVASVLEGLSVLAGAPVDKFVPNTPSRLRAARTCYDHLAGTLGVTLHDRLKELGWLATNATEGESYELTSPGAKALVTWGVNVPAAQALRRRFAVPCLDWSERRSHLGGALGAALLTLLLKRKWVTQEVDSRAVAVTALGRRELQSRLGLLRYNYER